MKIEVVEFGTAKARYDLVETFLEHRRRVFVEKMGWPLSLSGTMEFDQYDVIGAATYIIAHHDGQVMGGCRLLRCDTRIGTGSVVYSYMIRDAHHGIIDLPKNICWDEPPADKDSWELTRLLMLDPSPRAVRTLLDGANEYIEDKGGNTCLFLGPESFLRMAKIFGYKPVALGDVVGNDDGSFLAFSCPVKKPNVSVLHCA